MSENTNHPQLPARVNPPSPQLPSPTPSPTDVSNPSHPSDPPPPYESIAARGTSIRHVYLTPGLPLEEEDPAAYLEPSVAYSQPRDSGLYSSIDEMGLYSDTENGVYQGKTVVNPLWYPPKPPTSPAPPPRAPVGPRGDRRCMICAIATVVIVGLLVMLAVSSITVVFLGANKTSKSGQGTIVELTEAPTSPSTPWSTKDTPIFGGDRTETCTINTDLLGLAVPEYTRGGGYTTYNCHVCPQNGCPSEVHMIAMYEPEGSNVFDFFSAAGDEAEEVPVLVVSSGSQVPLTFVFSSYEAAAWVVHLPEGVTVQHVFLMSYNLVQSSVKVLNAEAVEVTDYHLHLPASPYTRLDYKGTGSVGIEEVTRTMTSQYGCLRSFSGRYVAKSWTLNLDSPVNCEAVEHLTPSPKPNTVSSTTRVSPTPAVSETSTSPTRSTTPSTTMSDDFEHVDCSTNPCENGARCTEAGAGPFYCSCSWPYYGQRCESVNKEETCDISRGSGGIATPFSSRYGGGGYSTHHCAKCPSKSCKSEVHMIAMYEPEGTVRGFQQLPTSVPQVPVEITSNQTLVPLSLVLSSYEATNWVINPKPGIRVSHVYLMSYYLSQSSIKLVHPNGTEIYNYEQFHLNYYMDHRGTGPPLTYSIGYGCSSCKGVDDVMATMTSQYNGCFGSFSGEYVAKSWSLNLSNQNC